MSNYIPRVTTESGLNGLSTDVQFQKEIIRQLMAINETLKSIDNRVGIG